MLDGISRQSQDEQPLLVRDGDAEAEVLGGGRKNCQDKPCLILKDFLDVLIMKR